MGRYNKHTNDSIKQAAQTSDDPKKARKDLYAKNKQAKGGRTKNAPKKAYKQSARMDAKIDGSGTDRLSKHKTKNKGR